MSDGAIGKITHYYANINVAIVELAETLKNGDEIRVSGPSTDFSQTVSSMQYNHQPIEIGKPGDIIGLKVTNKVKEGDIVYKKPTS